MRERNPEAGYALIVVVLLATLVLLTLATATPSVWTQGQREKEEELIFRGEQHSRGVGLFYRKFARFPNSIDELLWTNDRAFLRRAWPDPVSRSGRWRLIHVGPAGQLIGSVTTPSAGPTPPLDASGGNQGPPSGLPPPEDEDDGDEDEIGPAPQEPWPPPSGGTPPASSPSTPSPGEGGQQPIIGVASRSTKASIRKYNGYEQYNQWEFIYDPVRDALRNLPPGAQPPAGQPPPSSQPPARAPR